MHASPCAYGSLVFILAFLYKFMLSKFQVKDAAGISTKRRFLRLVWVQLRRIHAGVIQPHYLRVLAQL